MSPSFSTDFPPVVEMSPEVVGGELERGNGGLGLYAIWSKRWLSPEDQRVIPQYPRAIDCGTSNWHRHNDKEREPSVRQAMIPESIMLRCIANCLETSRYYASKGNRPLADWWHDRAEVFAERLATEP
jgi:hypothetical protein